jgi:hypothetical protein
VPDVHRVLLGVEAGFASAGVQGVGGDNSIADRDEIVALDPDLLISEKLSNQRRNPSGPR